MSKVFLCRAYLCCIALIALLVPIHAYAITVYAGPSGSGGTCSISQPCRLNDALNRARRGGDTVILRDGVYRDRLETKANGITIAAQNARKAIIKPSGSPVARIGHSDIILDGISFDAQGSKRGIILQDGKNISNVEIKNCHLQNAYSAGIALIPRQRGRIKNVKIHHNTVNGTGLRSNGEGIYVGDARSIKSRGKIVMVVENVKIYNNHFSNFTDNCIDVKPPTNKIEFYNNTCEKQVKGKVKINQGTIVLRGVNGVARNNKIQNVIGGNSLISIAANGGNKVYNNTFNKSIKTKAVIQTREPGIGRTKSQIYNNTFSNLSSRKVHLKYGLKVYGNRGL